MRSVRIGCSGWNYGHWRERIDVYAYFNNDWEGYAPETQLCCERTRHW